ncbi:MAG: hypothetical protein NT129_05495 [Candidatus Aenigmarchaeota archaeon]|nr:hypothetical protein [Candidatus Aenigmarchaeota archaeon]
MNRFVISILLLIIFIGSIVIAQPAEKTTTVDVSIQSTAEITVYPTTLSWTNVNPGSAGGTKFVDVINTGSLNVSLLYAYVDTLTDETFRPYGIDNSTNYAAGGVITMINKTGPDKYYFAGRIEWNWTEVVSNANFTNINGYHAVAWGFFRNTSSEYFWAVANGTNETENGNGLCNNTGTVFGIEDDIDAGTMGTRTPVTTSITRNGGDANYSYFSVSRSTAPLSGYCVAVNATCDNIYIYKYDKRPGFSTCTNSRYLKAVSMTPSTVENITLDVFVPRGMPAGSLTTATLTFSAS